MNQDVFEGKWKEMRGQVKECWGKLTADTQPTRVCSRRLSRRTLQMLLVVVVIGVTFILPILTEETIIGSYLEDPGLQQSHNSQRHAAELIAPALAMPEASVDFNFIRNYIDVTYGGNGKPGWVRAGDMDNDNDLDIVAGGGKALFIYENDGQGSGWNRYGSLDGANQIGANGAVLFDVNNDGYLDIVSAQYESNMGWWQNPGGGLSHAPWTFHILSQESRFLHDLIVTDLDGDGVAEEFVANLNVGYWSTNITLKWYRPAADPTQPWAAHTIEANRNEGTPHGHAGLDIGDIDGDGHMDLAFSNGWYEAPDDPTGSWTWHEVTTIYGISNALLQDMDGDSDLDLIVTGGHHGQGVFWLAAPPNPAEGVWTQHNISAVAGDVTTRRLYDPSLDYVHHPECLSILDLDGDNDLDVVVCELFFGEDPNEPDWSDEAHNVYVYENGGDGLTWQQHNIAPNSYPSHLLQMVDINNDGRKDFISEAAGYSVVSYYENNSGPTTDPSPTPSATATATPSPTATSTPTTTPLPTATSTSVPSTATPTTTATPSASPFSVKINFQSASAPVPGEYLIDDGSLYGNRGNGYTYGWNADTSTITRDRNSTNSPDQRYDTLIHLQKPVNPDAYWEILVPNGTYMVTLVAGDPDYFDSVYQLMVGDIMVIEGTPNSTTRWFSETVLVTVNNGRIRISNGPDAENNKLNFVDITAVGMTVTASPTPTTIATNITSPTATSTATATPTSPATATATASPTPTATATNAAVPTPTITPTPVTNRVTEGLQVLYTFQEGSGTTVQDVSGQAPMLPLTIYNPANATWLSGGGLSLDSTNMLYTTGAATKVIEAAQISNEMTLEAWIVPANITQDGPARIISLSFDTADRNVTLAQGLWSPNPPARFDVRLRTTTTGNGGIPSLTSPNGTASTALTHVVYTRDAAGNATIYVDGTAVTTTTISGDFSNWDTNFPLLLGNEGTLDRPWLGELHLVAIYNQALTENEVNQNFIAGP